MGSNYPDFGALSSSIDRCAAAYAPDDGTARRNFARLGCNLLGRYCNDSHQAVALRAGGRATITLAGTRLDGSVAEAAGDLIADLDFSPLEVRAGRVAAGAHHGLGSVFSWALGLFKAGEPVDVEGHSLGGQRTLLAPLWLPAARIGRMTAWEPPKAADDRFYHDFMITPGVPCTTVLNGADPWAAWPWFDSDLLHPPGPILHLRDGTWSWTTRDRWTASPWAAEDHEAGAVQRAVSGCIDRASLAKVMAS